MIFWIDGDESSFELPLSGYAREHECSEDPLILPVLAIFVTQFINFPRLQMRGITRISDSSSSSRCPRDFPCTMRYHSRLQSGISSSHENDSNSIGAHPLSEHPMSHTECTGHSERTMAVWTPTGPSLFDSFCSVSFCSIRVHDFDEDPCIHMQRTSLA